MQSSEQLLKKALETQNAYHASVYNQEAECQLLAEVARGIRPDLDFEPVESITGKLIKHYSYDRFDEVWAERFENGVLVHRAGVGNYYWFYNKNSQKGFELAKTWGARSKSLNSMFG